MLTTRQFAARQAEFARRGAEIVRIFHSPVAALGRHVCGLEAVPYEVLADPARRVYRLYGVGASLLSLVSRAARDRVRQAKRAGLRARWRDALRDGFGDGRLLRVHYGEHFADSTTPEIALEWIAQGQSP